MTASTKDAVKAEMAMGARMAIVLSR